MGRRDLDRSRRHAGHLERAGGIADALGAHADGPIVPSGAADGDHGSRHRRPRRNGHHALHGAARGEPDRPGVGRGTRRHLHAGDVGARLAGGAGRDDVGPLGQVLEQEAALVAGADLVARAHRHRPRCVPFSASGARVDTEGFDGPAGVVHDGSRDAAGGREHQLHLLRAGLDGTVGPGIARRGGAHPIAAGLQAGEDEAAVGTGDGLDGVRGVPRAGLVAPEVGPGDRAPGSVAHAPPDREARLQLDVTDVDVSCARADMEVHAFRRVAGSNHAEHVRARRHQLQAKAPVGACFRTQHVAQRRRGRLAVDLLRRDAAGHGLLGSGDEPPDHRRPLVEADVGLSIAAALDGHVRDHLGREVLVAGQEPIGSGRQTADFIPALGVAHRRRGHRAKPECVRLGAHHGSRDAEITRAPHGAGQHSAGEKVEVGGTARKGSVLASASGAGAPGRYRLGSAGDAF